MDSLMMLQGKLNPVIAGYTILFFGKKGFSTLARATRVMIRSKRNKGKWLELKFTKRHKLKAHKEQALYKVLKKISYANDIKKKPKTEAKKRVVKLKKTTVKKTKPGPKKPEEKKKPATRITPPTREEVKEKVEERAPEIKSYIKFKKPFVYKKVITTRENKTISIQKYEFDLKKNINFSSGREYDSGVVNEFIDSVKTEFTKVFKIHGRKNYLIRINHEYTNFINYYDAYPEDLPRGKNKNDVKDRGFGGFSLNRQNISSLAQIDDQFNYVLSPKYLTSFSRYLNFSNPSTEFNFSGFMIEVTVSTADKPKKKKK